MYQTVNISCKKGNILLIVQNKPFCQEKMFLKNFVFWKNIFSAIEILLNFPPFKDKNDFNERDYYYENF